MVDSKIELDFDPKTIRLVAKAPFYLVDVLRGFPSRRFEPKSKTWRIPLVRSNIEHLKSVTCPVQYTSAAEAALRDFEKLTAGPAYVPFPQDHEFSFTPYPHQQSMLDKGWALKPFAIFAEMGTGKTFTTINMAVARFRRRQIDRMLIICPQTLRRTWRREFKKYAPEHLIDFRDHVTADNGLPEWSMQDDGRLKVLAVSVEGLGISEKLYKSVFCFFARTGRTLGVVDESSRIKNPRADRTQRAIELARHCEYRMILNGTPIAKGIQDLWSQFEFLDPNIIGSGDYWAFRTRYLVMGGFESRQIVGYQNVEELMALIRPYSIDVRKSLLNLPEKVYKSIFVQPTPDQKVLFKQILTGVGAMPTISVKNVLERMLRCQQVIGGFQPITDVETGITQTIQLKDNPKMKAMMDFIEDNKVGTKFIIWARYVPEIHLIVDRLREAYGSQSVLTYYGETTAEQRAEAETRYCNDPSARFLVGNPSAAGLGLTLISGENDVMFYYSGTFAYIDRAQSEDRAHRIGQKNSVLVVDCVMEGSIDEAIQAAIAEKKDIDTYVKDQVANKQPAAGLRV